MSAFSLQISRAVKIERFWRRALRAGPSRFHHILHPGSCHDGSRRHLSRHPTVNSSPDPAVKHFSPSGACARTLSEFLAERERSLAWLAGLSAPDWSSEYQASFGPITAGDLAASWAAHDLLHTRQLLELRRVRLLALTAPHRTQYAGDW